MQEFEHKSYAQICRDYEKNPDGAFSGYGNLWKESAKIAQYERLIGQLYAESWLTKEQACSALEISRGTYYRWKKPRPEHSTLRSRIKEIALQFPRYDYRSITKALHRQCIQVNISASIG